MYNMHNYSYFKAFPVDLNINFQATVKSNDDVNQEEKKRTVIKRLITVLLLNVGLFV